MKPIKFLSLLACAITVMFCGCSTLSSLGLPTGATANKLIQPARTIANKPSQAYLLPKELAIQPLPNYIIEIGDTILIEPVKFDTTIRLPGDQIVKPDGFVSLGGFGRLMVSGKSIEQIRDEAQKIIDYHLERELRHNFKFDENDRAYKRQLDEQYADARYADEDADDRDVELEAREQQEQARQQQELAIALERDITKSIRDNEVSARLVNWDSKKIYVLGEVSSPGSYVFTGHQTVLDALIEAGGMTTKANQHEIIVSRPSSCGECKTVMKICYAQIVQLGDASTNYQLMPGDRIFVPALTFCDDVRQSLSGGKYQSCPKCATCPEGCDLPQGCR